MSSADRPIRQPHRRPSLSPLLLSGALYWAGFRRRRGETIPRKALAAPPERSAGPAPFATAPHRPHSWRDVASQIWTNIGCHRVMAIAAGVTFYALLAIFPAIAAVVTLYGLFADTHTIVTQLNSLAGVLPGVVPGHAGSLMVELVGPQIAP